MMDAGAEMRGPILKKRVESTPIPTRQLDALWGLSKEGKAGNDGVTFACDACNSETLDPALG